MLWSFHSWLLFVQVQLALPSPCAHAPPTSPHLWVVKTTPQTSIHLHSIYLEFGNIKCKMSTCQYYSRIWLSRCVGGKKSFFVFFEFEWTKSRRYKSWGQPQFGHIWVISEDSSGDRPNHSRTYSGRSLNDKNFLFFLRFSHPCPPPLLFCRL